MAGVFVDRLDKRLVLIVTNVLRGAAFVGIFFVGDNLVGIYLLNIFVSTVTVFFAPAEAAMIPIRSSDASSCSRRTASSRSRSTRRSRWASRCSGPLVVKIAGAPALILIVAVTYFIAAGLCVTLPEAPPTPARCPRAATP